MKLYNVKFKGFLLIELMVSLATFAFMIYIINSYINHLHKVKIESAIGIQSYCENESISNGAINNGAIRNTNLNLNNSSKIVKIKIGKEVFALKEVVFKNGILKIGTGRIKRS